MILPILKSSNLNKSFVCAQKRNNCIQNYSKSCDSFEKNISFKGKKTYQELSQINKIAQLLTNKDIKRMALIPQMQQDEVYKMIIKDEALNFDDALDISEDDNKKEKYLQLISKGIDKKIASIMVNADVELDENSLEKIVSALIPLNKKEVRMSLFLTNYLSETKNSEEFANYLSEINFQDLAKIAPLIQKYSLEEYLAFVRFHFENGCEKLNKETMNFGNLSDYLKENYLKSNKLNSLIVNYPATNRNIGEVPSDWLDNLSDDEKYEAIDEIYRAIELFIQNISDDKVNSICARADLSFSLSKILNKPVEVTWLDSGAYGQCYKISISKGKQYCIKIFRKKDYMAKSALNGAFIEAQTGMFLNQHSRDFVKMYFGKVASYNCDDSFIVTQFLDENIIPEENEEIETNYTIIPTDVKRNKIQDKIIDFGSVIIRQNKS